ncbi:MAG: TetR/AcrR family transcriptional regulator [Hyphomonadaceae bacterium]|nr:TetR/AcrR family transcriptional regulator [Hyphomonadaceae bacterium]
MSNTAEQRKPGPRGANRERILRAALDIISKRGVDKVTHRAVAAVAGVSPGTTTYHFATREDLVRDAFSLYIDDYQRTLVETLTQRPVETREDFIRFLGGMTTLNPAQSGLEAIEYEMVLFAGRDDAMRMRVAAWSRTLESWLSDPLERLGASRPLEAARMLVAMSRGSEFEVLSRSQEIHRDQFASRLSALLNAVLR